MLIRRAACQRLGDFQQEGGFPSTLPTHDPPTLVLVGLLGGRRKRRLTRRRSLATVRRMLGWAGEAPMCVNRSANLSAFQTQAQLVCCGLSAESRRVCVDLSGGLKVK